MEVWWPAGRPVVAAELGSALACPGMAELALVVCEPPRSLWRCMWWPAGRPVVAAEPLEEQAPREELARRPAVGGVVETEPLEEPGHRPAVEGVEAAGAAAATPMQQSRRL